MSGPTAPADPADPPAEDDDSSSTNASLGIVFGMLGVVLMLTLDDTRVAGLPFVILGITFFVMGIRPVTRKRDRAAVDDTQTPPPPA
jgi:succinate-acetate transporter protein